MIFQADVSTRSMHGIAQRGVFAHTGAVLGVVTFVFGALHAQLKINTEILAYARTLDVWGKSGKFDVILFSKNDNYFGGNTLEQDPVYTTQAHANYDFGRGVWAALDVVYDYGRRTTVNGVRGPPWRCP